ncbi:MAG: class E sortase [Actinobacteria bacterium]|nr:class E sortase [Actinomycetota bacterium]
MARTPTADKGRTSLSHVLLGVLGKTLIWAGLLLLGFTAYQLWGTGLQTSRFQSELEQEFTSTPQTSSTSPSTTPQSVIDTNGIDVGDAIGKITIEKIDVDDWIVAGVSYKALKKGPGLFPDSALPGSLGNSAIAGHRTTFGAPFADLDKLNQGDIITVTTRRGVFTYAVRSVDIVKPSAVEVLETTDPSKGVLTLVTCHPKWTSANRLIVSADLQENATTSDRWTPAPTTAATTDQTSGVDTDEEVLSEGWLHDPSAIPQTLMWAIAAILMWWLGGFLGRRLGRQVLLRAFVVVPFLVALYFFYENLSRLTPTNL